MRSVGWLTDGQDFAEGPVDLAMVSRLADLLVNPWQPVVSPGRHSCEFCRLTGGPTTITYTGHQISLGSSILLVPGKRKLYVPPSLILHYTDAHEYSPPPEFGEAVLACPPMRSIAYLKALRPHLPPSNLAHE